MRGAGIGIGGVILVLLYLVLGGDPSQLVGMLGQAGSSAPASESGPAEARPEWEDELAEMVSVVLADTEDVWTELFDESGRSYQPPTLVLFTEQVRSACGLGSAAAGPFYCPADRRAYIDLSFFRELDRRFGAPGDFAAAYVLAHEVGHHVQNLLGTSGRVQQARSRVGEAEGNALSVRLELQADCYAGLWASRAQARFRILEDGDVEEALGAAAAIGDDTLQRNAGHRVTPESWTHGSSAQRVEWFRRGFAGGQLGGCDTFADLGGSSPR